VLIDQRACYCDSTIVFWCCVVTDDSELVKWTLKLGDPCLPVAPAAEISTDKRADNVLLLCS